MDSIPVIDRQKLTIGKQIGAGGYGIVSKATYDATNVVIKELNLKFGMDKEAARKEFVSEMEYLNKLKHPNIVKFYGRCSGPKLAYIMEYMLDESLHKLLYAHKERKIRSVNVLNWAEQCSSALEYLHGSPNHLIHGDLKPENILMSCDFQTAKIADFGKLTLARLTLKSAVATFTYKAPELFNDNPQFDGSVDVYAFAISLWEIFARKKPFANVQGLPLAVRSGKRPPRQANMEDSIWNLMDRCWMFDPTLRPPIKEVHEVIANLLAKYQNRYRPLEHIQRPQSTNRTDRTVAVDFDFDQSLQLALAMKHSLIEQLRVAVLVRKRDLLKQLLQEAKEYIETQNSTATSVTEN